MQGTLVVDGSRTQATTGAVADLLSSGAQFWLDLDGVDDEASGLLANTFRLHPLAIEDAEHFGQRPKIDEFDDFTYFVVHGACPGATGRRRCTSSSWPHGVTVHHGECPSLDRRLRTHRAAPQASQDVSPEVTLLYMIVDSLIDSFFPVLSAIRRSNR